MPLEVDAFVSTGATLPVGKALVMDAVTIGASTGVVEMVKLMDGTIGSSAVIAASSNGLGAVGLNVFLTNSTGQPGAVTLVGGQSSVSVVGSVGVTFSTASTGAVVVSNTTANAAMVQLVYNSSLVSTSTPLPVLLQNSTATVTIQGNTTVAGAVTISGNSTAIISSASIIKVDTIGAFPANSSNVVISGNSTAVLSTASMGGSTGNPIYVVNKPWSLFANSTWASTKVTSTATVTLFSSAASTRFNLVDLVLTNAGTAECVATIYDGSTTGTKLFLTDLASAGGGVSIQFGAPRRGSSGLGIIIETIPASSVYVNVGAFRSS